MPADAHGSSPAHSNAIAVWPNPATDHITLGGNINAAQIDVLDITGKKVGAANGVTVDVHSLSPGTYYLVIHSGAGRYHASFVKY